MECGRGIGDSKRFKDSAPKLSLLGEEGTLFGSERDEWMCMMCIVWALIKRF